MFNWKYSVLFAALILSGCSGSSNKTVDVPLEPLPTAHVSWPTPLTPCKVTMQVLANNSGESAVVQMPYQEYLDQRACDADKNRYISGMNSMVCFYRKDLNEQRCSAYVTKEETQ